MNRKCYLLLSLFTICSISLSFGQTNFPQPYLPEYEPVFVKGEVSRVDITIDPTDLAAIYLDPWSDTEYPANFVFTSSEITDTVLNVGFRPRGNFSRGAAKKSFKVAINSFEPRRWRGFEKLNLNGQHNDPAIIRAHLCSELLHHLGVPAPRSSHTEVYINGDYYGLYINVEHIDEEFVMKRFGNNDGNLFKCTWPADLDWFGSSQSAYESTGAYELKTNKLENDWSDLIHLIDVLNNTPTADLECELPKVLNVESYLKAIAHDVMTAHWDGPIYNKNNFYLYHNLATGQWEFIPYDMDNTFGISWSGTNWETRDIYDWAQSGEPRPLYNQIMAVPAFRERFTHYCEEVVAYFDPVAYPAFVDSIHAIIRPYAVPDTYRTMDYGYDMDDFDDSYDMALWGHVKWGVKEFAIDRAANVAGQVVPGDAAPGLSYGYHLPTRIGEDIPVSVFVEDDMAVMTVELSYSFDGGTPTVVAMLDDGMSFDGPAADGRYGVVIPGPTTAATLSYQITAQDAGGNSTDLACDEVVQIIDQGPVSLHINEFLAWNTGIMTDPAGETDDWVEIYNSGSDPVYLGDLYLSDNRFNPDKWQLPDATLPGGEFLLIWCDEDASQGADHANFQLDNLGEEIGIFDSDANGNLPIHLIVYGPQTENVTQGCLPDGEGPLVTLAAPTAGFSNMFTGLGPEWQNATFRVYPNPANEMVNIRLDDFPSAFYRISLVDGAGRLVCQKETFIETNAAIPFDLSTESGLYHLVVEETNSGRVIGAAKISVLR